MVYQHTETTDGVNGNDEYATVQVRLSTRQDAYATRSSILAVPLTSKRADLAKVVLAQLPDVENSGENGAKVDFDFGLTLDKAAEGTQPHYLLTATIADLLLERGLSRESVINLEYWLRDAAPEPLPSCPHPDWVSAISASIDHKKLWAVSGCYDGFVYLWSADAATCKQVASYQISSADLPLKCVDISGKLIISGGHDQTLTFSKVVRHDGDQLAIVPMGNGRGHAGSVESARFSHDTVRVASGSADTMVKIWLSDDEAFKSTNDIEASKSKKKRLSEEAASTKLPTVTPQLTLSGHRGTVTAIAWLSDSELISAGLDHMLVKWDLSVGNETAKIPGPTAFLSVDECATDREIVLTGSADRHVRLYDFRQSTSKPTGMFSSHTGWVSAVTWLTDSTFASGSYDKLLKLWDMRRPTQPLYQLTGHSDKVLALAAGTAPGERQRMLFSGSADATMNVTVQQSAVH